MKYKGREVNEGVDDRNFGRLLIWKKKVGSLRKRVSICLSVSLSVKYK